jgi:hypothetical protein
MEERYITKPSEANKAYLVKGRIIKARCETIEAANLMLRSEDYDPSDVSKAKVMVERARGTLRELGEGKELREVAHQLKIEKYLHNANRMGMIISQVEMHLDDEMLQYLSTRVTSEEGSSKFSASLVGRYFKEPKGVVEELLRWGRRVVRSKFLEEQEQEFIVDPISYVR